MRDRRDRRAGGARARIVDAAATDLLGWRRAIASTATRSRAARWGVGRSPRSVATRGGARADRAHRVIAAALADVAGR
jgi:hypothetical protein